MKAAAFALAFAAAAGSVAALDVAANEALYASLVLAPTQDERIKILANDSDFVFNFLDPTVERTTGEGGFIVLANSLTFPALYSHGMSMSLGVLGPCSMNSPHTHPRATEFNVALNGTLHTGMLAENGARFIVNDVGVLSATFFPAGAIHFEANLNCAPVYFIAAFNHPDPGVGQVAQRFYGLPPDVVGAALGGLGVEQVVTTAQMIPDNIILASDECFARCGIPKPAGQPTAQQQPRVSGNAYPSPGASSQPPQPTTMAGNYYGNGPFGAVGSAAGGSPPPPASAPPAPPPASAPPASMPPAYTPPAAAPAGAGAGAPASLGTPAAGGGVAAAAAYPGYGYHGSSGQPLVALAQNGGSDGGSSDSTVKTLLIVVLAINGLLVFGILIGAAVLLFRKRETSAGRAMAGMGMSGPSGRYSRTKGDEAQVVFAAEHHDDGPNTPAAGAGKWYDDPYSDKPRDERRSEDSPRRSY